MKTALEIAQKYLTDEKQISDLEYDILRHMEHHMVQAELSVFSRVFAPEIASMIRKYVEDKTKTDVVS